MPRRPAREVRSELFTARDVARFWAKVDKSGDCWMWTAAHNGGGYGHFRWNGSLHMAHRWSYVLARGSVDPEQVIDHLCRNPRCVNPSHLEAVDHATNVRRGIPRASKITRCTHGHEYDQSNTGWYEHPRTGERERFCRACKRGKKAEWRADPVNRAKAHAYAKEYGLRPEARQRSRESAARYRASWSPEKHQAKIEYLRAYRQRKREEKALSSGS